MSRMPHPKPLPAAKVLLELLEYHPETGLLFWRKRNDENCTRPKWFNSRFAGKEAFTSVTRKGYKVGLINGVAYTAHRIIWRMATGNDPGELVVDHVNRETTDNRLENLRLANHSQNQFNKIQKFGGTSKYKGVGYVSRQSKWQAFIRVDGRKRHLGTFDNERAAAVAYDEAALNLHGEFALTNSSLGVL